MSDYPRIAGYPNLILPSSTGLTSSGVSGTYPLTYLGWRPSVRTHLTAGVSPTWIKKDMTAPVAASCFGMAGHTCGTGAVRVVLKGCDDNANYVTVADTGAALTNDFAFMLFFAEVSYRYWKIEFQKSPNTPEVEIGVLYLGEYLEFPVFISEPWDPDAHETSHRLSRGDTGLILADDYEFSSRIPEPEFEFLTAAWVEDVWMPWWLSARKYPVFFAWDPDEHPLEVYYMAWNVDAMSAPYDGVFRGPLKLKFSGLMEEA